MEDFREWCDLPGVVGAINGTHFDIRKPHHLLEDYFYFKSGGYSMQCQAVVDREKHFLDVYVGMPGSTNDCRMLKRSTYTIMPELGGFLRLMSVRKDSALISSEIKGIPSSPGFSLYTGTCGGANGLSKNVSLIGNYVEAGPWLKMPLAF
jgi:hypothetical protein